MTRHMTQRLGAAGKSAAESGEIMAEMTPGATRPSPCLCSSQRSEGTAAPDSRKLKSHRLKAPLKLGIRYNRRDEKGPRVGVQRNAWTLAPLRRPFEADPKWDTVGQFSVSTACQRQ